MQLHQELVALERRGDVWILRLTAGENRFNLESLAAIGAALDEVEASEGPAALVITGEGKFFSNGLDLDWLAQAAEGEPAAMVAQVHALLARLLAFPAPTVGALNGHVFAAGLMLALALDQRVMRADRGFACLPEVDISIPFTDGMTALIAARLPGATAHEAMTTGRRYGGEDAAAAGIVDVAVAEERVLDEAVERAAALAAKRGPTLGAIKRGLYADALARLEAETAKG